MRRNLLLSTGANTRRTHGEQQCPTPLPQSLPPRKDGTVPPWDIQHGAVRGSRLLLHATSPTNSSACSSLSFLHPHLGTGGIGDSHTRIVCYTSNGKIANVPGSGGSVCVSVLGGSSISLCCLMLPVTLWDLCGVCCSLLLWGAQAQGCFCCHLERTN